MSTRTQNIGNSNQVELSGTEKSVKIGKELDSNHRLQFLGVIHYNNDFDLKETKEFVDGLLIGNSIMLDCNVIDEINSRFGEGTLVESLSSNKETKNVFVTNFISDYLNGLCILKRVRDYYSISLVDAKVICDDFLMNSIPRELDVELISQLETEEKCKFEIIT